MFGPVFMILYLVAVVLSNSYLAEMEKELVAYL